MSEKGSELISVIVPIFNIKEYVEKCIKSIVGQTYTNLEIILVDDGSTDGSGEICDQFALQDDRITVFHKTNGGLSDARNYALDRVNGDLIAFVDGDDWIHPEMYEIMHSIMKEKNADIVTCGFEQHKIEFAKQHYIQDNLNIKILTREKALCDIETPLVVAWNKLYKSEIFSDIRYPKGKLHEDEYVIHRIFYKCTRIAVIDSPLYFYTIRDNSIVSVMTPQRINNALEAFRDRVEFSCDMGWNEVMPAVLRRYCDYCIDRYLEIRNGKYTKLDDKYMDILWQSERDILQKYPNVQIDKKYRCFAVSPEIYDRWIIKQNRKYNIWNRLHRVAEMSRYMFSEMMKWER